MVFFSDILWDGIIKYHFLRGRVHFLISFVVFLAPWLWQSLALIQLINDLSKPLVVSPAAPSEVDIFQ